MKAKPPVAYDKNHPQTVQEMFNAIADSYDTTNSVLSCGLHKQWNQELIRRVRSCQTPHHFLDLCTGTGEIAFGYLKNTSPPCKAYLLDFSSKMLDCARQKASKLSLASHSLEYLEADAQRIPLEKQSIQCVTMAYGIRNIHHPPQAIQEIYRVLKPGGCVGILELTRPHNLFFRTLHRLYLKTALPLLGGWMTSNSEAYHYLNKSIDVFMPSKELEELLVTAGFSQINRCSLTGGIATIVTGYKPL